MTARPCLTCGDVIASGSHCRECQPIDNTRDKTSAHWNTGRWKNLSKRLRRQSPFCETCSSTAHLQVDHILPITDYVELTYEVENLRVLCRTCNGRRGANYTVAEAERVLSALLSTQTRRPSPRLRKLIPVAQRAVQVGSRPPDQRVPPVGKAHSQLHSGMVPEKGEVA